MLVQIVNGFDFLATESGSNTVMNGAHLFPEILKIRWAKFSFALLSFEFCSAYVTDKKKKGSI